MRSSLNSSRRLLEPVLTLRSKLPPAWTHSRGIANGPGPQEPQPPNDPPPSEPSSSQSPSETSSSSKPSLSSPRPRKPPSASSPSPVYSLRSFNPEKHSFETVIPRLPTQFGANQRLTIPDETRALLEGIVGTFRAPIRYAFAYGSGVFKQSGYSDVKVCFFSLSSCALANQLKKPMLDFIFAVSHADHWHSINLEQNPSHYPLASRVLGSGIISRIQDVGPGLWFNAYVPINGVVSRHTRYFPI